MKHKQCFKCNRVFSVSFFYKHSMMKDGFLGKCKDCARKDGVTNRLKRLTYYREFDRKRERRKSKIDFRKKYRGTSIAYNRVFVHKNPFNASLGHPIRRRTRTIIARTMYKTI